MTRTIFCVEGMRFWGTLAARLLNARLFVDEPVNACDVCYVIGMYDWPLYAHTTKMTQAAKKRVIIWCGTDALQLPPEFSQIPYLPENHAYDYDEWLPEAVHVCDSETLKHELEDKGVSVTAVIPWPAANHFEVTPLPKTPLVAFYTGSNGDTYGLTIAKECMERLGREFSEVSFVTYGFNPATATMDFVDGKATTPGPFPTFADLVANTTVYLRLTRHDGGALSAKEYLEAGRYVVCTADIKHADRVNRSDPVGIISALRRALKQKEPNREAAAYWKEQNTEERWLKQMGELDECLA